MDEYKTKRQFYAISIKHTEYQWSFGKPCVLWGRRRTDDDEKRCYAGYTEDTHCAELYSIYELIIDNNSGTIRSTLQAQMFLRNDLRNPKDIKAVYGNMNTKQKADRRG